MPKLKFEKKETLSRKEAAARLREIAQALGAGEEFELKRGGEKLEFDVPNEVSFELEIEMEDGETELEVEIKWSSQAPAAASAKPSKLPAPSGPAPQHEGEPPSEVQSLPEARRRRECGPFDRAALVAESHGTRQRRVGD
jgi:amphi-Trp domain-containing protein